MKINTIDFDDRIIDALLDYKLVIFAGAGVSMGKPSNLPSFVELTKKIANRSCQLSLYNEAYPAPKDRVQTDGENNNNSYKLPLGQLSLDRFLRQLAQRGAPVHKYATGLLKSRAESAEPNELHKDLIRLFPDPAKIRLVTTNFDLQFEEAARDQSKQINRYRAPALPYQVYLVQRTFYNILTDMQFLLNQSLALAPCVVRS